MTLPTQKNQPGQSPLNKKFLIYAEPKVGKSTLASKLFPDAIFIATDPTGLEELEVFKVNCRSWDQFRQIGKEINELRQKEGFPYEAIVVDTVDELSRFCGEAVLSDLPGGPPGKAFKHVSDWEWGKGYDAITEEFRLRVASLCNMGLPVVFISHAKERKKKDRTGLEITIQQPDIGKGQLREWLLKFVDFIFYADVQPGQSGEVRLLHTMPSETYLAGGRQPEGKPTLPEPLPLDGRRLRAALEATAAPGATTIAEIQTASVTVDEKAIEQIVNGKAEPKKIQRAREIVAGIDEEKVKNSGYTAQQSKALRDIAEFEAKQKEAASA